MINVVSAPQPVAKLNLSLLRKNVGHASGQNLGGKFALPVEFDTNKYAAAFYREGQEVLAMQQDQPLIGTDYVAPGWAVWRYPGVPVKEEKIEGKKKKKETQLGLAGSPHKIAGMGLNENYLLMFRDKEVQDQINQAYADQSRKAMVAEASGETLAPDVQKAGGMLTNKDLAQAGDREVAADREYEESFGRSAAVHGTDLPTGGKIRRPEVKVHR